MDKARQQQELHAPDSASLEAVPSVQQKVLCAKSRISEKKSDVRCRSRHRRWPLLVLIGWRCRDHSTRAHHRQ
eukprot:11678245-Karenia_brevis.AAC.1